ncbi:MAG: GGDEF domain-containing protein [Gammaproteobacteria bacterium]|nr:GGDEF domain-containing protein [Gammaproteobacteria bacterium]
MKFVDYAGLSGNRDLLKGFSRTIREIEWLLVSLVILHLMMPTGGTEIEASVVAALVAYVGFVLFFHYFNFYLDYARWKLLVQAVVMALFITVVLWLTGKVDSLLVNLYLLVVVLSALALGKYITLALVVGISVSYLWLGYVHNPTLLTSLGESGEFVARLAPFWLVTYVTTMLASDIHDAKRMVEIESETDVLTGILNMRGFRRLAASEHRKAARYGRPYAVLMVDADNLKGVNDAAGHEAGNQLIRLVADLLQQGLRNTDLLARFGGDEFVLLLVETDLDKAGEVAERLCKSVARASTVTDRTPVSTTVSIGVAAYPQDGAAMLEVVERADQAMYRSKQAGRNQVSVYSRAELSQ